MSYFNPGQAAQSALQDLLAGFSGGGGSPPPPDPSFVNYAQSLAPEQQALYMGGMIPGGGDSGAPRAPWDPGPEGGSPINLPGGGGGNTPFGLPPLPWEQGGASPINLPGITLPSFPNPFEGRTPLGLPPLPWEQGGGEPPAPPGPTPTGVDISGREPGQHPIDISPPLPPPTGVDISGRGPGIAIPGPIPEPVTRGPFGGMFDPGAVRNPPPRVGTSMEGGQGMGPGTDFSRPVTDALPGIAQVLSPLTGLPLINEIAPKVPGALGAAGAVATGLPLAETLFPNGVPNPFPNGLPNPFDGGAPATPPTPSAPAALPTSNAPVKLPTPTPAPNLPNAPADLAGLRGAAVGQARAGGGAVNFTPGQGGMVRLTPADIAALTSVPNAAALPPTLGGAAAAQLGRGGAGLTGYPRTLVPSDFERLRPRIANPEAELAPTSGQQLATAGAQPAQVASSAIDQIESDLNLTGRMTPQMAADVAELRRRVAAGDQATIDHFNQGLTRGTGTGATGATTGPAAGNAGATGAMGAGGQFQPGAGPAAKGPAAGAAPISGTPYDNEINAAAAKAGIPAPVLASLLEWESGFNPTARSSAGATGVAQFMPQTAQAYGLTDPTNAPASIDAAARYLADLYRATGGDLQKVLAGYNGGPNAIRALEGGAPFGETQRFIAGTQALMRNKYGYYGGPASATSTSPSGGPAVATGAAPPIVGNTAATGTMGPGGQFQPGGGAATGGAPPAGPAALGATPGWDYFDHNGKPVQPVLDANGKVTGATGGVGPIYNARGEVVFNPSGGGAAPPSPKVAPPGYVQPTSRGVWPTPGVAAGTYSSEPGDDTSPWGGNVSHAGVDIPADEGSPANSVVAGRVQVTDRDPRYGVRVIVAGDDGNTYIYGHLQSYSATPGDRVEPGTNLGKVGHTGIASGPHLHLEVRDPQNRQVDPRGLFGGPAGAAPTQPAPPPPSSGPISNPSANPNQPTGLEQAGRTILPVITGEPIRTAIGGLLGGRR